MSEPFSFTCNQLFEPLGKIMTKFFDFIPIITICGSIFEGSFKSITIGSHVGPYLDGVVLQVTADPCHCGLMQQDIRDVSRLV